MVGSVEKKINIYLSRFFQIDCSKVNIFLYNSIVRSYGTDSAEQHSCQ